MSDVGEIYDLARRCIQEAGNWSGTHMHRGLLDIARQLRERAQAIEAQRAGTTKIGSVADESAVAESDAPKGDA